MTSRFGSGETGDRLRRLQAIANFELLVSSEFAFNLEFGVEVSFLVVVLAKSFRDAAGRNRYLNFLIFNHLAQFQFC